MVSMGSDGAKSQRAGRTCLVVSMGSDGAKSLLYGHSAQLHRCMAIVHSCTVIWP